MPFAQQHQSTLKNGGRRQKKGENLTNFNDLHEKQRFKESHFTFLIICCSVIREGGGRSVDI